ncbi:MAG: YjbQ family protein [Deltaproteobacteria bacterium]|nr:YjbQ family protein [Candidatus Anaeroferrophillus wilburensis]MBN2887910.1 YjbQ family protein [Deltaproteobacteria bacterium]
MPLYRHTIKSSSRCELLDIAAVIAGDLKKAGVQDGTCIVFVPHTTAAVTINENADPSVKRDILTKLADLIPRRDDYHHLEGNSDAHLKAGLLGFSQTLLVADGRLLLGTWQDVYFAEFDGPRTRTYYVKIIAE